MAVKKPTEHICFRDKEITDMHKILTGNGNPEVGLCRQVAILNERQGVMTDTLKEIQHSLSGSVEVEKEIEIQKRVKEQIDGIRNIKFTKKTAIIGLILYALMLLSTVLFSFIGSRHSAEAKEIVSDTKAEVDMMNVPVRTRSGVIQWWPSGIVIDSVTHLSK